MNDAHDANLKAAIQKAKQKDFTRSARTKVSNLQKALAAEAKARGLGDYRFTQTYPYKDRGKRAGLWPMELTDMLLKDKGLVRENNDTLMQLVCARLNITPYRGAKMSDEPTKAQRAAVVKRLEAHGYRNPSFKNMTEVKALVAGGPSGAPRKSDVSTSVSFDGPDRLVLGTKSYPIEARRGKPTGDPLADRCARIQDVRMPLSVVMEVLGIPRSRGSEMFEAAVQHASVQAEVQQAREDRKRQDAEVEDLFEADQLESLCLAEDT